MRPDRKKRLVMRGCRGVLKNNSKAEGLYLCHLSFVALSKKKKMPQIGRNSQQFLIFL